MEKSKNQLRSTVQIMETVISFCTRMHPSRMRTTRLLTLSHSIPLSQGGFVQPHLDADPPDTDPLEADPPGHVTCDACREDRCKNITLPQTSFASGSTLPQTSFASGNYCTKCLILH